VLVLLIYRFLLTAHEDTSIHVDVAERSLAEQQAGIAHRVELVDYWGRLLTIVTLLYGLGMAAGVPLQTWVFPKDRDNGIATFDEPLLHEMAVVVGNEARAKHHQFVRQGKRGRYQGLTFWSPNINIFRDPRWGRGQETYGEDPFLTGTLGVQFIRGLQGNDPKYFKTVATVKHFAVHSGPEPSRHTFDAVVSERDLRETYLPHFEMGIRDGGAYSLMCAYNRTNGEPCCEPSLPSVRRNTSRCIARPMTQTRCWLGGRCARAPRCVALVTAGRRFGSTPPMRPRRRNRKFQTRNSAQFQNANAETNEIATVFIR
jgi:hypothetical protein